MNQEMRFRELYGKDPEFTISAPARTELGGNHTDHQHGLVLAAPIDLTVHASVRPVEDNRIRIYSEGYGEIFVDLADTSVHKEEYGTPAALVRGTAAHFLREGLMGFDACMTSEIPAGSGLSSSAAMEILLGRICAKLTDSGKSQTELAIIGQMVENNYFGKPCGLLDQMACAGSGVMAIDFQNPACPAVKTVDFDFEKAGYSFCIIDCGAGHENLTEEYARVPEELAEVCRMLGVQVLREVKEEDFYRELSVIRKHIGDRAVLRAIHVFEENKRVAAQTEALEAGDLKTYFSLVKQSGNSSWKYLQNVIPGGAIHHQEMAIALALAEKYLEGEGASRLQGGGFAGNIQAYVPVEKKEAFVSNMEAALGVGSCRFVKIG